MGIEYRHQSGVAIPMNLITVCQGFPDHESCIEHVERACWDDVLACPLCGSVTVTAYSCVEL